MCYSDKDSHTYQSFHRQYSAVTLLFSSCTQCFQLSRTKSGRFCRVVEAVFQFFCSCDSLKTATLSLENFTLLRGMISGHKFTLLCLYMFSFLAQQVRSNEQEFIVWCLRELEESVLKADRYKTYSYGCTLLCLLHQILPSLHLASRSTQYEHNVKSSCIFFLISGWIVQSDQDI